MKEENKLELTERWPKMIERLRDLSILLYAVSLSLGITYQWAVLLVGIVLSFALVACQKKPSEELGKEFRLLASAPLTLPIAGFVLAATLSGLANGGWLEAWRSFTSLRGMLVYFWAYQAFSSKPELKQKAVLCALVVGAIAGVWAMIQQITGFHPHGFRYLQGTGFLGGPMAFAGLMQIFSMLAFGLSVHQSYKSLPHPFSKFRVFALIVAGNVLGVLFAAERSAWLGVVVALLFSTVLLSWRIAVKTGIALLAVALILWCTVPVVQTRLAPLVNWQTDISLRVRVQLWRESIELTKQKPLFGVGIRNFPHHYIPEALGQGHKALDHAHSNYMHIMATTGLVGCLAYIALWVSVIFNIFAGLKPSITNRAGPWNQETGIKFGILAGVIALLVSGIFEYNFGTAQVRLTQWFLFGMIGKICSRTEAKASTARSLDCPVV